VISTLKSITPKPIDPKYKLEYVYSVANNGKEYELGGVLEKTIGMNHSDSFLPQTHASTTQNITLIK